MKAKTPAEFLLEMIARDAISEHLFRKGIAQKMTSADWTLKHGITDIETSPNQGDPTFSGKTFRIIIEEFE